MGGVGASHRRPRPRRCKDPMRTSCLQIAHSSLCHGVRYLYGMECHDVKQGTIATPCTCCHAARVMSIDHGGWHGVYAASRTLSIRHEMQECNAYYYIQHGSLSLEKRCYVCNQCGNPSIRAWWGPGTLAVTGRAPCCRLSGDSSEPSPAAPPLVYSGGIIIRPAS